jgi:hypothetical protein
MIDPVEFGKQMGALVREGLAPVLKRLDELESRQPERGEKGEPGERGADAEPLDADLIVSDVMAMILGGESLKTLVDLQVSESMAEWLKANPIQNGLDGAPGPQGPQGPDGQKGADGIGLADALIDREGALVVTMTDGRHKSLGVVVGKDGNHGEKGMDGKDGLSFETVSGEYDASRGYVLTLSAGDRTKELVLPYLTHKGFWSEGKQVKAAESITHDGALWIAKRDTTAKPCIENADDWALAARKGRDGRDGKDGKPPPGPVKLGDGNA